MSLLDIAVRKALANRARGKPEGTDLAADQRGVSPAFVSPWHFDDGQASPPESPVAVAAEPLSSPQIGQPDSRPQFTGFSQAVEKKLVVGRDAQPVVREQFRKIAAALYRLREKRKIRVVMVASALPNEGKTLTATNLALTLSESYRSHVLLVDVDLRRGSLHQVFDIPHSPGLKEGLTGDGELVFPAIKISSHLKVLTAGMAAIDPMGALTSDRLRRLLHHAAGEFEWAVLDTPPLEFLPDAKILASLADAAILVVRAGSTKLELSRRALEAIGRDKVLGVVLNRVTEGVRSSYYEGYEDAGEGGT